MATTARPITELAVGIRDTTGAVVASGKARFYLPGTTTPTNIYSDDVCTAAITQPLTLNAGGQYISAYALEATRMVVKDSTETTTYYDGLVNVNRHDAVYVTSSAINGGAETTLEAVLGTASTSFGSGFQYKVTSTGTARNVVSVISERCVSVKDFGATGDGVTNDYPACQATIDYVAGLGGGIVFFPVGTYLINTGLSNTTVGVSFLGAGQTISVIKNGSTSNTALTYNVGSAVNAKAFLRDFGVTASTTSSGSAIVVSNGDRIEITGVSVALHRTGIDTTAVTAPIVTRCVVLSTDDNASAIGIRLGTRGKASQCEAISGTDNGTGISLANADSTAFDCYSSNFATGMSAAGTNAGFVRCNATGATTGFSLAGTAAVADSCRATSNTTGISVGAVASVSVNWATYSGNTTDLSVNNSATNFYERGNWATLSAGTAGNFVQPIRSSYATTNVAVGNTWTPTHTPGGYQNVRGTGGAGTVTVAAPTGSTKVVGDVLFFQLFAASVNTIFAFNATYKQADGSTTVASMTAGGNSEIIIMDFIWTGSVYILARSNARNDSTTSPQA
jgi:hypothetical protein